MEPYCNMNSTNRCSQKYPTPRNNPKAMYPGNRTCPPMERSCGQKSTRSMEMDCICTTKQRCHKEDPMEKLGKEFPVVMAYVPWQQWGELYDDGCGLKQGTIFKDLNQIFCGVRC